MNKELTKTQREIIRRYCPECGHIMTIGKKGGIYCDRQHENKNGGESE